MLKITVRYTRYALLVLTTIGFGRIYWPEQ
jgi:hypothetical protein